MTPPPSTTMIATTPSRRNVIEAHSHSIVDGGFEVMSSATRFTAGISLMMRDETTSITTLSLPFEEKTLTGSYFGSCVPRIDFPRMLALYARGTLKLDELITRRYSIDQAPQAFADLESGKNARGVIVF